MSAPSHQSHRNDHCPSIRPTRQRFLTWERDFCDKNILMNNGQYIVIDPMPMIGDPCSNIGFIAAYHPLHQTLSTVRAGFAAELGYDQSRCARWTAVWLTHQACESWREDSEELYALVGSSTVEQFLND